MKNLKTNKIAYLAVEEILVIHTTVIKIVGGSYGVRDNGRLEGVVNHPKQAVFGKELRLTLYDKAAAYGFDIIKYHPFVDGNKRTGMSAMEAFLELNGFRIQVKKGEIEKTALLIATSKMEIADISEWLKKNSKKI